MEKKVAFVGLDVHAKLIYIAIALAGRNGEVSSLGSIPNRPDAIRKKMRKLQKLYSELYVCYEAGPCGYVLYWQLISMGINCDVIAPSLIPKKPGEKIKTDRLDALKLAKFHRSGDLTAIWVPDAEHEALRDLVRARTAIKKDLKGAKHRVGKFILKSDFHHKRPAGVNNWTLRHMHWLKTLKFEQRSQEYVFQSYLHEVEHHKERLRLIEDEIDVAIKNSPVHIKHIVAGLQLLRGVAKTTAIGVVTEVGSFLRFENPNQLMAYAGSIPSEYTTGGPEKKKQGGITKMGNSHLRKLITEASWSYRFKPSENDRIKKCQKQLDNNLVLETKEIAWKAQKRLCGRYRYLLNRGKSKQLTVTAVGRELLGFIWNIATNIEREQLKQKKHNAA